MQAYCADDTPGHQTTNRKFIEPNKPIIVHQNRPIISNFAGLEKSLGMYALAISPNKRYLAVSELGDRPIITIYDLQHELFRKKKVLMAGDLTIAEFVSMSFSPDCKYLIAQSSGPDWVLFYWKWERQKVMATVKATTNTNPIYQVHMSERRSLWAWKASCFKYRCHTKMSYNKELGLEFVYVRFLLSRLGFLRKLLAHHPIIPNGGVYRVLVGYAWGILHQRAG